MQDAGNLQQDAAQLPASVSSNTTCTKHSEASPIQEGQTAQDKVQHDTSMSGLSAGASLPAQAVTAAIKLIRQVASQ